LPQGGQIRPQPVPRLFTPSPPLRFAEPGYIHASTAMIRMMKSNLPLTLFAATATVLGRPNPTAAQHPVEVHHKTVKVGDLDIFYREAGPRDAPTILLLHGFPTSSQMLRKLIPALGDKYDVVAPDYPGFGHSSMPTHDKFAYTFDNLARVLRPRNRPSRHVAQSGGCRDTGGTGPGPADAPGPSQDRPQGESGP
jgi:predicted alpha/beta-fold hydrolase